MTTYLCVCVCLKILSLNAANSQKQNDHQASTRLVAVCFYQIVFHFHTK